MTEYGAVLRRLLDFTGSKLYAVADEVGYDVSYISKWCNKDLLPAPKTAHVVDVALDSDHFSIRGFTGTSALARGNPSFQHFFIGGRYVKSALLSRSLEDGYHGFLMQHQYPFCALHLNFAPGGIDVNVHPTKQEVRIEDGPAVAEALCLLVAHRLSRREDIAQVEISEPSEPAPVPKADTKIPKAPEEPEEL